MDLARIPHVLPHYPLPGSREISIVELSREDIAAIPYPRHTM